MYVTCCNVNTATVSMYQHAADPDGIAAVHQSLDQGSVHAIIVVIVDIMAYSGPSVLIIEHRDD